MDVSFENSGIAQVHFAVVLEKLRIDGVLPEGFIQPVATGPRPVVHPGSVFLRAVHQNDHFRPSSRPSFLHLLQVVESALLKVVVSVQVGDDGPFPGGIDQRFTPWTGGVWRGS